MNNRSVLKKTTTRIKASYPILSTALKWASALLIFYGSRKLDDPLMCKYRTIATLFLPMIALPLMIRSYRAMKACPEGHFLKKCEKALFMMVLLSSILTLSHEIAVFQYKKRTVLTTSDDLLNRLGRHFIVGYRTPEEILRLVRKRAIGGVYITARNIGDKTTQEVRRELGLFQSIASKKGCPPLFVAADQEGGKVSRLSPLLPAMPALSSIIRPDSHNTRINDDVNAYAAAQAMQLASLGINLNLSPVVDLKTDRLSHKLNIHSRIDQRAISANIRTVTQVAGVYCETLLEHGVRPTLKHFPGLGSVSEDTHFSPGTLDGSKDYFERNDWRPFRQIVARTDPFIMLGHVRVPAVDPALPASLSPKMITDIIRNEWKFDGVLITDDLNMGAIAGRKEGIGKSAVRALNAGADLVLLSYDGRQYYNAMYEMIKAYQKGSLDQAALNNSARRLLAFRPPEPSI
jgi:beta-N-acetylhexosaminidase